VSSLDLSIYVEGMRVYLQTPVRKSYFCPPKYLSHGLFPWNLLHQHSRSRKWQSAFIFIRPCIPKWDERLVCNLCDYPPTHHKCTQILSSDRQILLFPHY